MLIGQDSRVPLSASAMGKSGLSYTEAVGQAVNRALNDIDIPTVVEKDGKKMPKRADRLNVDLANAEVYSKLDQKMITAWLDLRNKAAHGKYEEHTEEQVKNMLLSVTDFMARVAV